MAISQLNTLFTKHHRVIFGVFAVLIVFAFIMGDTLMSCGRSVVSTGDQIGEIFGESISYNDVNNQMQLDSLYISLFQNGQVSRDDMVSFSFQKMAMLKMAQRAGIYVTDKEIFDFIQTIFRDDSGKFVLDYYNSFVTERLVRMGYSEEDFEAIIRQHLIIEKYNNAYAAASIIPEGEIVQFYNLINAELEVLVCTLPLDTFAKQVVVTDEALDAFFQANRNNYVIPAKVDALVVSFAYQQYRSKAIENVKDDQLKAFYDQNPYLFAVVNNGQIEIPEFEAVKDQVRSSAIAAAARDMAVSAANEFASASYESISELEAAEGFNAFKALIQERALPALRTGLFESTAKVAGSIADEALVKELAHTTDVPVSNAVAGAEAAYVGFVAEYIPSRLAEFDEVKAQVTADYVRSEAMAAAQARGQEILVQLNELPAAERVAAAMALTDFQFKALPKFTLMNPAEELGYGVMLVVDLLPGELFDGVIPGNDNCQLLLLKSRTNPATPYAANPMFEAMFQQKMQQISTFRLQEYINNNCLMVQNEAVGE